MTKRNNIGLLKINELIDGTNKLNDFEMSVPKKVTAGWARRDVMCRALSCLFLIFEQRSYCPARISRTSWPPTPAKTNSGILTCYIQKNANRNIKDRYGKKPLQHASQDVIQYLNCSRTNATFCKGCTIA
ncbi:unnamed protein product [Tenebrio molitor]|nr:unnamed protein product [Tenebrio molitor]